MNLDDFKPQWQQRQRDLDGKVDHVIDKVRSRMSKFDTTIWWRDMRESLAAILLIVWYSYDLLQNNNWLYKCGLVLGILACILIVVILNWARVKGKTARTDLPVEDFCKEELVRLDRQIWLLRNVHWWYLGPLAIALAVQIAGFRPELGGLIMFMAFVVPLFGFLYWANRVAVRCHLLPLRRGLTRAVDGDSDHEAIAEDGAILPLEPFKPKLKEVIIAVAALLFAIVIGECLSDLVDINDDAPRVSPFSEVRFEEQQIVVTYQKEEYQWLELDGIKVEDITSTAKTYYWGNWKKRVSEDLGDVLWKMDHQPSDTVALRLRNLETNQQQVIEDAPMTSDNRHAVRRNRRPSPDSINE